MSMLFLHCWIQLLSLHIFLAITKALLVNKTFWFYFSFCTAHFKSCAQIFVYSSDMVFLHLLYGCMIHCHHCCTGIPRPISAPAHPLSLSPNRLSFTGTFGKLPFRKKSLGYYVQPDAPFPGFGTSPEQSNVASASGGDSDSSQDSSWQMGSIRTVNLPLRKAAYKRGMSLDVTVGKSRSSSILQSVFSTIGLRRKFELKPVSQNEMVDRLKKLVTMAVDTVVLAGTKFLFSFKSQCDLRVCALEIIWILTLMEFHKFEVK